MSTHKKPKRKPASKREQPASKAPPPASIAEMNLRIITNTKEPLKRRVKLGLAMLASHQTIVQPILEQIALEGRTPSKIADRISAKFGRFETHKPAKEEGELSVDTWTRNYLFSLRTNKQHRKDARKWWDGAQLEFAPGAGAILDEFKEQDAQP